VLNLPPKNGLVFYKGRARLRNSHHKSLNDVGTVFNLQCVKHRKMNNDNIHGSQDKTTTSVREDNQVKYLAETLNASLVEVRRAITSVGNNREDVETYLKNNQGRYNLPRG
jgi:hypothetical protein